MGLRRTLRGRGSDRRPRRLPHLWYRSGPATALVASEPDDTSGDWREVPDRSLLLATAVGVRIVPLHSPHPHPEGQRPMAEGGFTLADRLPAGHFTTTLHADVRDGLGSAPGTLSPKWFYDKRGSELFEQITRLPEYYPTRAEQEILTRRAPEIAQLTRTATLVELGSGSSRKTRLLLDALSADGTLRRYAPLVVSATALDEAGRAIGRDYPGLTVSATVADFETDLALSDEPGPRLLAFLGSTFGNFDAEQRGYRTLSHTLSSDDALLLGADLVKDPEVLVRAYDDAAGVTADFNKNVLHVLNRELGADFDLGLFDHIAPVEHRMRTHRGATALPHRPHRQHPRPRSLPRPRHGRGPAHRTVVQVPPRHSHRRTQDGRLHRPLLVDRSGHPLRPRHGRPELTRAPLTAPGA